MCIETLGDRRPRGLSRRRGYPRRLATPGACDGTTPPVRKQRPTPWQADVRRKVAHHSWMPTSGTLRRARHSGFDASHAIVRLGPRAIGAMTRSTMASGPTRAAATSGHGALSTSDRARSIRIWLWSPRTSSPHTSTATRVARTRLESIPWAPPLAGGETVERLSKSILTLVLRMRWGRESDQRVGVFESWGWASGHAGARRQFFPIDTLQGGSVPTTRR